MSHDTKDTQASANFKHTLNLPQTSFPIRSNAAVDDPIILNKWKQDDLYKKAFNRNKGAQSYILHDGPPYANGHIHLGTAYNKILKDVFSKSHRMMGMYVPVTPGWDCHGLPIELKVVKEFPGLAPQDLKAKCRAYASQWIDIQREEFKRLGVVMDWDNPYLTMSGSYEADTVRAFGKFVEKGYISRKNKTVSWCASCQTVLAAAEIEYHDRKDPSVYVTFELDKKTQNKVFPNITESISLLIWTTTPWTLPLNKMVMLKADAAYSVLDVNGRLVVVGQALVDKVLAKLGAEKKEVATCLGTDLQGGTAYHPFIKGQATPILCADLVGLEDGTACVHGAPGCGPEDYEVGVKNNIEIYSPISTDGCYTEGIKPEQLLGVKVTEAHGPVIALLQENNALLFKESIKHSYPHCWRCRNGLIFRATKQWFCELAHNNFRERAIEAVEQTTFIPERTKNRLKASVGGRLEWCLSRQRVWGTPIVALICNKCDTALVDVAMIERVAKEIEKHTISYWDVVALQEVLPHGASCLSCKGTDFRKETDILDVWFDSGVSQFAVLKNNPDLGYPATVYSEGSDQHRGWFQSSMLAGIVLENQPCTKIFVTHGYTVDEKGHKMSKSLGNVVVPQEMIDKLGTDGLRLWAASIDLESDAIVSNVLLENVKEVFRKVRNTCRFLVSNLYDFCDTADNIALEKMLPIDQYALQKLHEFSQTVQQDYKDHNLTGVVHAFADYCTTELSSFYLDIIKDRLYTDGAQTVARRSAQTACYHILDVMTRLMAPILSFTAEQLSDCYQKDKKESIHLQDFAKTHSVWDMLQKNDKVMFEKREKQWQAIRNLRSMILKALEQLRQVGTVKHSLEAKVVVAMNTTHEQAALIKELLNSIEAHGHSPKAFLKEYCIVSDVDIIDYDDLTDIEEFDEFEDACMPQVGLLVQAEHARGNKCPRCWQWQVTDNSNGLCNRCHSIVVGQ